MKQNQKPLDRIKTKNPPACLDNTTGIKTLCKERKYIKTLEKVMGKS
ncbi:hypothetical protein KsCSTR_20900 [Candidatus Kuenenia stuttgartiensis]|jgi:hypothetical protein|uniref:Uncharacterized protein n=1 Tax=Kuenenia stuttgartiensis TaxID=174633 RepID=A0A6G7GQ86_KUEST|nr:hypothetical protein KsCSTR_20900 [Candidatus Kuenenia stuttgartiensis]